MSHFLARLVERSRGTAPRVEALLAPRFASTPFVEISSELQSPTPHYRDRQANAEVKSSPPADIQRNPPTGTAKPNTVQKTDYSSLPQQPGAPLIPVDLNARHWTTFVRPSPPPDGQPLPAMNERRLAENLFTASRPTRSRPAAPLQTASRNVQRGPLNPNESSDEPPIVRVTIGRIDVRATPASAAPRAKSSPRSEPKLTLDAYLKSRREGRR